MMKLTFLVLSIRRQAFQTGTKKDNRFYDKWKSVNEQLREGLISQKIWSIHINITGLILQSFSIASRSLIVVNKYINAWKMVAQAQVSVQAG